MTSKPVSTLKTRLEIIDEIEKSIGKANFTAIGKKFNVDRRTVSRIYEQREKLREEGRNRNLSMKRKRHFKEEDVDAALIIWFRSELEQDARINRPILRQKAIEFAREMDSDFKPSDSWITRFIGRYNLKFKLKKEHGVEKQSRHIFNADETSLCFKEKNAQTPITTAVELPCNFQPGMDEYEDVKPYPKMLFPNQALHQTQRAISSPGSCLMEAEIKREKENGQSNDSDVMQREISPSCDFQERQYLENHEIETERKGFDCGSSSFPTDNTESLEIEIDKDQGEYMLANHGSLIRTESERRVGSDTLVFRDSEQAELENNENGLVDQGTIFPLESAGVQNPATSNDFNRIELLMDQGDCSVFNSICHSSSSSKDATSVSVIPMKKSTECAGNKQRRTWSNEDLALAQKAYKDNQGSIRKISQEYGIPRATLFGKIRGRRQIDGKINVVLREEEESTITTWLKEMSSRSFNLTKSDLLITVKRFLDGLGRRTRWPKNMPGHEWYRLFLKRHSDLTIQNVGKPRTLVSEDDLKRWFRGMKDKVCSIDSEIFLDPTRIFHVDKSGFSLDAQSGKVLSFVGLKSTSQDPGTLITVLVCANATGYFPPPLLVYPPTHFTGLAPNVMFPDCLVSESANGRINRDLFADWLEQIFIPQTATIKKPVLLLVDGHASHQSMRASRLCDLNGIILYALLVDAYPVIQPLDIGVFSPLKSYWEEVLDNAENDVTKCTFATEFKRVYNKVTGNKDAVFQAFKECGLFPLDFSAIDKTKLLPLSRAHNSLSSSGKRPMQYSLLTSNSLLLPKSLAGPSSIVTASQHLSHRHEPLPSVVQPLSSPDHGQPTLSRPSSSSKLDSLRMLILLTSQLGEEKTNLFLSRIDGGYDTMGDESDPAFDLWKSYHQDVTNSLGKND